MHIDVRENSRRRLHVVLRTRLRASLGVALLLIVPGLWAAWMLCRASSPAVERIAGLVLAVPCLAGALLVLASVQWVTLQADRKARTLQLTHRMLLWPLARRRTLPLQGLRVVHVLAHTLRAGRHALTSHAMRLQWSGQVADEALRLTFLPVFSRDSVTMLARLLRGWVDPARISVLNHARGWPFG